GSPPPKRPPTFVGEANQVLCSAAGLDDAIEQLAELVAEPPGGQCCGKVVRPRQLAPGAGVAFQQLFDDQILFRAGQELGRTGQRQDAFRFSAPDDVESVRRPGAGRRRTEASVQATGEGVPQGGRGVAPRSENKYPFGI